MKRFVLASILLVTALCVTNNGAFAADAINQIECSASMLQTRIAEYEKGGKKDYALKLYPVLAFLYEHERDGTVCDSNGNPFSAPERNLRLAFFHYLSSNKGDDAFRLPSERVRYWEKQLAKTGAETDSDNQATWVNMLHEAHFPRAKIFKLLHEIDEKSGATVRERKEEEQ